MDENLCRRKEGRRDSMHEYEGRLHRRHDKGIIIRKQRQKNACDPEDKRGKKDLHVKRVITVEREKNK